MILKLHRAYKVIGFTQNEMPNEWPKAFSLEHIAKLQFPENASDKSVFFYALKAACTGGSLKHIATIELRQHKLSASGQHHINEVIRHAHRDNSYEVTVHYVDHRDLAAWLEKQGEEPSAHLAAWFKTALSDTPTPPKGAVGASGSYEPWKEQARARAYEIIKRDKAKDLYPNQVDIADEIAKQFRKDGLNGADGKPLTGAYIKRWALKGISSAQSKLVSTVMR